MLLPFNVAAELLAACLGSLCLMHLSAEAKLQGCCWWGPCVLAEY